MQKTKISATIVADSKNEFGNRITTMLVTFPRFILAELNTHRMLSKNSASSRAIPFNKMVEAVKNNPFIPIAWQKEHKGMQGTEYWTDETNIHLSEYSIPAKSTMKVSDILANLWLEQRNEAVIRATLMDKIGATKQLCNRLLEPFMWHTVLITATELENFFSLRCPKYIVYKEYGNDTYRSKKDLLASFKEFPQIQKAISKRTNIQWLQENKGQAEIHMMALAEAMWDAYNESTPKELKAGEWHIPFGDELEENLYSHFDNSNGDPDKYNENYIQSQVNDNIIKISTAMCARTSYTVVGEEGKDPNYQNDINLHNRLSTSGHWSPFEHCAQAMSKEQYENNVFGKVKKDNMLDNIVEIPKESKGWCGNFRGFIQYRKMFENENAG